MSTQGYSNVISNVNSSVAVSSRDIHVNKMIVKIKKEEMETGSLISSLKSNVGRKS